MPEAPKYIRDQIGVYDIKGTSAKSRWVKPARDSLNIADIEGSSARNRTFHRRSTFNSIDYRDVTNKLWETKRSLNPLSPTYCVRD